ncbi:MAG: hypothetical protein ACI4S3_03955 [Candidatus Gastranaerophilaceae bacterium]
MSVNEITDSSRTLEYPQTNKGSKPTVPTKDLFVLMTEEQAKEAGDDLYQKFLIADKDEDKKISLEEITAYKGSGINEEKLDKFKNLSDDEKIVEIVDLLETKFGHDGAKIPKKKSKEKVDVNSLVKEKLGLDLSQYKTDEEKRNAIFKAMQDKYSTKASEEDYENVMNDDSGKYNDNTYLQTYKKLKSGDFSKLGSLGKSLEAFKDKLTEEQIRAYAAEITTAKQGKALLNLLSNAKPDERNLISDKLSEYDIEVQTMAWGAAIASAETKEDKLQLAKAFYEKAKAKIDAGTEIGQLSTFMVSLYSTIEQSMGNVENGKFGRRAAQYNGYVIANKAELHKVETGEISQAEYNRNYSGVYAAAAHKLDNADDAYKYVIDNTNDDNRSATMNVLASTAYQIKDEAKRNNAISTIKSSEYYNSEVEENLNKSSIRALNESSGDNNVSTPNDKNSSGYITNPVNNPYSNTIHEIITNGNKEEIYDLTDKSITSLDEKGSSITPQERYIRQQNVTTILNSIISNNLIQNSKYERILLNKLSAKSIPTLLNMFFNCNSKVQDYFFQNHLVTPLGIAMNASEEQINQLPDEIKKTVQEFKN